LTSAPDFLDVDFIGEPQDVELLTRDRAWAANGKSGPGKGMPADEGLGQTQFATEHPHLVLEQFAQRLDQLHVHALGQPADVVMRLDGYRWASGERHAFDHIRIERALRKKLGAADFLRLCLEHIDEQLADGLALLLRILNALERLEERFRGIHVHERNVVALAKHRHDFLRFGEPHQAMIDEHAGELTSDRFMNQHRGDGAVDAARQPADHAAFSHPLADFLDRLVLEGAHCPVAAEASDLSHEIAQKRRAVRRVHDFEVELRRVKFALVVADDGYRRIGRCAEDLEALWQGSDPVTVAHPHRVFLTFAPGALEQRRVLGDRHFGASKFTMMATLDLAAELLRHHLLAITDAEQWHASVVHHLRRERRVLVENGGWTTGKNHCLGLHFAEGFFGLLERHDLAIDLLLPDPARDELGNLGAEIDDQNLVVHGGVLPEHIWNRAPKRRSGRLCAGFGLPGQAFRQLSPGGQRRALSITGPRRGMFDIHLLARERPCSSDLLSPTSAGGTGSGIASGGTGWSVSTCRTVGGATAIGGGNAGAVVGDAVAGTLAGGTTGAGGKAVSCGAGRAGGTAGSCGTGRTTEGGSEGSCGAGRTPGARIGCAFASAERGSDCLAAGAGGSSLRVTSACRTASSH